MNAPTEISTRDRVLGGLWGSLVGDALGVPVEFKDRATVQSNPVRTMRGFGSHKQPPGTWSDDSSLLLCSAESLVNREFDTDDMGKRFVAWAREELWTPHGRVFDIGSATAHALSLISSGVRAEVAGGESENSNGNGSLMRIIPVSVRFSTSPTKLFLDRVHRASSITHRHTRSLLACGLFSLVILELLKGLRPDEAFGRALNSFRAFYEGDSYWGVELDHFDLLLGGNLSELPESKIESGGYVMHTLHASLWCLLTTASYSECVLKAVNLGGDTDTTGCVAGGLAGVAYGLQDIPSEWASQLARQGEIATLFNRFADFCLEARKT